MPLEEMLEQSALRMLAWATRWKIGAKQISKQMTIPIWKMWDPDRADEPEKKVDTTRITQSKQKKYKETNITNTLKVNKRC